MTANSFGNRFVIHTFGESHGPALGVVVDGCPAGVVFDHGLLIQELERRRPGNWGGQQGELVSQRKEEDAPEVLSGVYQGKTLGTPIAMVVRNNDQRSDDYKSLPNRQGHADDVWASKFLHSDKRGGGRSSGRETVARVMGGAVSKMFLRQVLPDFKITGYVSAIGDFHLTKEDEEVFLNSEESADLFYARCPSSQGQEIQNKLITARAAGESYGGVITIRIQKIPVGLGQPVFHKLKSDLGAAMLSVGATAGVEVGEGFLAAKSQGTNFHSSKDDVYGGIRGGISTGGDIVMRVSMKPTSSILDVAKKGRHDPCIAIRAVPVLEAMASLVVADHFLWRRLDLA